MIKLALVDDQTLVRQGIRSLLELRPDLRVVLEAADGDEALANLPTTEVDVVLLDVRMPTKTGLEVLAVLAPLGFRCILLTTFDDDAVALAGVRLGARGFLLKDISLEQLENAVRTVAAGGSLIQPAVTARVISGAKRIASNFPSAELPDPLTPRELDVLRWMAAGQSNREIAATLGVAEGTVKNHASAVLSKLGVRDRTRAVLRALELGVL
ncbi:response regulator transcription factor [soil metagenome]